jgi:hypothetical protein
MKMWSSGSRVEGMADIMPNTYAHFPSSQKKIRLENAVKKNCNLNILTNVDIDILVLISKSHTQV